MSPIDVPPFARRRWTATRSSRPTPRARRAGARRAANSSIASSPARSSSTTVGRGRCVEIATGAPLPTGADAVVMVEETERSERRRRRILRAAPPGQNVGRRGADIEAGDRVVAAGDVLVSEPRRRAGGDRLRARRGLRAAARRDSLDGQRSGRAGPAAAAGTDLRRQPLHARRRRRRRTAAMPEPHRPVQDALDALVDALDRCAAADLIVFSGGSSVGERDLIVDAVAGARRDDLPRHRGQAWQADGVRASSDGTPFFGMPGNPTSCLSNAYMLLVPFLRATARLPPHAPR